MGFGAIFIDTAALLARYLRRDQYHEEAIAYWRELELAREQLVTSNFVLDETCTLLGRRAGYPFAAQKARNLYASRAFTILRPDATDERRALDLFEKFADQEVSFTDCVSFVLMRAHDIDRVFTFDHHFAVAGFTTLPNWSVHEPGPGEPRGLAAPPAGGP